MEGQNIDHVGNSSLAAHYWQGTDRHTTWTAAGRRKWNGEINS
jgi:hypothetical protein